MSQSRTVAGVGVVCGLFVLLTLSYRMAMTVVSGPTSPVHQIGEERRDLVAAFHPPILPGEKNTAAFLRLEAAIPKGGKALTTMDTPYLFDFSKREILIAGYPGTASLPDGWPLYGTGENLAEYLLSHGIRYLAYSYEDSAFIPPAYTAHFSSAPDVPQFVRNEMVLIREAHREYDELAVTRKHVYDDGHMYLRDLCERR